MLEFALLLPLLLLVVFGVVGFGLAILDKVVITNAGREAARQGTVYRGVNLRPTSAQVQAVATSFCSQNLIAFNGSRVCSVTLSTDPATLVTGSTLTVTVTYPFTFLGLTGFINPFGGSNGITLSAATSMRAE
ncbi:MAG: TadE/TadG family type IV pilus assembly protein [Burkholderiales bacterium]